MFTVYYIVGKWNVEAWDDDDYEKININSLRKKTFSTREEKMAFSLGMLEIGPEHYTILDEAEYKRLTE